MTCRTTAWAVLLLGFVVGACGGDDGAGGAGGAGSGSGGNGGNGSGGGLACVAGSHGCACTPAATCTVPLVCSGGTCITASTSGDGDGDATGVGDGDGDGDTVWEPVDLFVTMTDPDRNKVQPGALCDRMTEIQCAGEALCCTHPGRDYDACKVVMQKGCVEDLLLDVITLDAKSGFDAVHAETAFTDFEAMASSCDSTVATWGASQQGLAGVLKGTVPIGGGCAPPNALTPTVENAAVSLVSCTSPTTQACLQPDPLAFSGPRQDWRCEPRSGDGGLCFSDLNCQDGLYCDNPDLAALSAVCRARRTDGSPCAQANQCLSLMCMGSTCVSDVQAAYCLAAD